ncbi:MAG: CHASE2 domain-containing protein [Coleofasciculaceae cyanobacterium]
MDKLVILSLGNGDLHNGFPAVTVQVWESSNPRPLMKLTGSLPENQEIPELYRAWQLLYEALYQRMGGGFRLEIEEADVTNVSELDFNDLCQHLASQINIWLNSESFRHVDQRLRTELDTLEEIRVIVETNDNQLRRLPWHLWNFLEDYPQAEVALSASEYQRPKKPTTKTSKSKVKILAIFGNSQGIDVKPDQVFLEQLSEQTEIKFLVEPQSAKLQEYLWQPWDILFFAGHSSSRDKGRIQLNPTESLTLDQLKFALKKAIEGGLKLAIFNSCDGLGLAQQLADLHIPQTIVMREPVPDLVAQEFLRHFLIAFSGGQSLYSSVREARERLQKLESKFPCATWLPIICQNPAELPITWQELCGVRQLDAVTSIAEFHNRSISANIHHLATVLLTSLIVTTAIMGVRHLGILQTWELEAYDYLIQQRPDESQDRRLLIVTITEEDFQLPEQQYKQENGSSLSDLALARLLDKLEPYQPRAIALDIYRDFLVDSSLPDLAKRLRNNDNFLAICKVSDRENNNPGVEPPPEIPLERQGFSDVVKDPDGILRRHLLAMNSNPSSPCTTPYALSAQLAFHYLKAEGISAQYNQQGNLQIGDVIFKRLQAHTGGYHHVDTWGYQILLNYRSYRSPQEIAPTVTLAEVLKGQLKAEQVKDRVVLVGVSAHSTRDYLLTPYQDEQGVRQEIPGVVIQAQMVSQILSAIKDGRPLIEAWPLWGDALWVWSWSVVGGFLVWRWRWPVHLLLAGGAAFVVLYVLGFGLLIRGYWVPLVPSTLALVVTGSSVAVYSTNQSQQK